VSKTRLLISLLVPVVLSVTFFIGAAHVQRSSATPEADPTCASSNPCIEYDNSGSGPGVRGHSVGGNGLGGSTFFNSTSSTNGKAGVFGNDDSSSGTFDSGVEGLSVRGTGVSGVSTDAAGVIGSGGTVGVRGIAGTRYSNGVEGDGALSGSAIIAYANGGNLFYGVGSSNPSFSVDSFGDIKSTGSLYNVGPATFGSTVSASGYFYGVDATVTGTSSEGAGVLSRTENPESWLFQGYSDYHSAITFEVEDGGTVLATGYGSLSTVRTLQKTSSGHRVDTYAPQVSQPTLEDFGEAQLVDGVANVALEAKFADAIDRTARYLVMLTPEGDCRGLYVALRSPAGFTVRELQGGRSSIAFSYRIVAKPFGNNSPRLPQSSMPRGFMSNSEGPPHSALPRPLTNGERR
jgi:hypothetical protein